ncbi:integrase catalytic domain-containing protein [Trichonephila clavipes]|nr:integrase catalytic domain-containing protein [Trichonephila clavipes]
MELVTSLSTESFILALRRFISRRGRPFTIYSDNGKNLVGTSNELKNIDWKKVKDYGSLKKINWKLNPPSSPWRDGRVRVVEVSTSSGSFLRPIQRLYPLEVSGTDISDLPEQIKETLKDRV